MILSPKRTSSFSKPSTDPDADSAPHTPLSFTSDIISGEEYHRNSVFVQRTIFRIIQTQNILQRHVSPLIDWSRPDLTYRLINLCIISTPISYLIAPYFPWRWVAIFTGFAILTHQTTAFKIVFLFIPLQIANHIMKSGGDLFEHIPLPDLAVTLRRKSDHMQSSSNSSCSSPIVMLAEIYEHQRWW